LAERELTAARSRVEAGTLAAADVHVHVTRLAEHDEAVVGAELDAQQRSLELGVLLGRPGSYLARSAPPEPPLMGRRSADRTARLALARSPSLAALVASRHAARERLQLAGEDDRPALDLAGWVQSDGLGHQRVAPALEQFGAFGAVSAHIGLRFEAPVGGRYNAERAVARAGLEAADARHEALRQRIETSARTLVQRASAARRRLRLARETVSAARATLDATRERHHAGEAIALEVQQAIDALRRAELRSVRLRVDWAEYDAAIRELTGETLGPALPSRCTG
jgi:cobalt-zinc-cadmium efflux system outer membrane protein